MILKASQRGGAKQLALHLLSDKNEHVTVHELSGFSSDTVQGAFQEIYAVSRATNAKKFLFSLSLNPPEHEDAPVKLFENTISKIEQRLGMAGQARAIIFHEKEGRRHAHCVWSRINTDEMKAIKLPYFKEKLNAIGKDIYLEKGWDLPQGFSNRQLSDHRNFTLAEWQQGKRHGIDPREIKAAVSSCWQQADNRQSLQAALQEKGFFLARGDRRGFVVVDWNKEVYALARQAGIKAKDIKDRLGSPEDLPSVDDTKAKIDTEYSHLKNRFLQELKYRHKHERQPLMSERKQLVAEQKQAREKLQTQQAERRQSETTQRQAKIRNGLGGLWDFITGRSKKQHQQNEREAQKSTQRDTTEKQAMQAAQVADRQKLQAELKAIRKQQKLELNKLNQSFENHAPKSPEVKL